MLSLLLLAALGQTFQPFEVDIPAGLRIRVAGITIVDGDSIQYYEDGWKKAYFNLNTDRPQARLIDPNTYEVAFSGPSALAVGKITYHRNGDHLKAHYDLQWNGEKPAKIELTSGLLSAQVLQNGTLTVDGKPSRSMQAQKYLPIPGVEERKYANDATDYSFDSPLGMVGVKTSVPTVLFDARGYDQDYADGRSVFWFGNLGLDVSKDKPVILDIDWQIQPKPLPAPKQLAITWKSVQAPGVITPDERPPLIIPKPTTNELKFEKPLLLGGVYDFPAGHVRFWEADFIGELRHRFEMPPSGKTARPIHVDGGVSKLGFHPGGYQITITADGISILGEEDEGLHNGLRRLAELAFPHGGKIALPTGYLSSNPQIRFRGVHLFVGPESRQFQKKLWERVLLPLGFNKVVLQCERTEWDCMPNMHGTPGYMTKQDLAGLFADYRAIGVEPIPLIQSFGHMEWFFDRKQNLELAVNPDVPYTIDPRKPKADALISSIWDEACELLKPSTIHVGCDEVDMLGFPVNSATLTTELWQQQMPVLKAIADKHRAQLMLWGDMALAPGEAIDATNGVSLEEAAKRRAAIPKGTWIGDWHYKPEPKIEPFLPSLQLWKKEGFKPIASAWYRPENVRSFDLAADVEKSGTLQTTWSGYFSSEQTLIENMSQFSAMVLAGDFSWSTRYDSLTKLGYDPSDVFRRMYFREPRPIVPVAGVQGYLGEATRELVDADMHFKLGTPIQLRSVLSAPDAPTTVDIGFTGKGSHIAIVMGALDRCPEGSPVARLDIKSSNGIALDGQVIRYGQHVRTPDDFGGTALCDRVDGLCIFQLPMHSAVDVRSIHLESLNAQGGLRVLGVIVW